MAYHMDLSAITYLDSIVQTLRNCDIFEGKEYCMGVLLWAMLLHPSQTLLSSRQQLHKAISSGCSLFCFQHNQLHPKYPWAGQANLSSNQIKIHHTLCSCVVCQTHEHPLQNCPSWPAAKSRNTIRTPIHQIIIHLVLGLESSFLI